jgi:hypothetical protein
MIKRLNFTGRKRIPRNKIEIIVHDSQPRTFDAKIDLDELSSFPDAAVYLEATCAGSSIVKRFDFGKVNHIQPPENRQLTDLEGQNVFFTLKVVDRSEKFGRILGLTERIHPQKTGPQTIPGRRGILPIEPSDLGQQLWRLEFRENYVVLLVNRSVPGLADRIRSDPLLYSSVYPSIIRHVLNVTLSENVDVDEEEDRWPVLWLRFGMQLHPDQAEPPQPDAPSQDREDWIEQIVEAFCENHKLMDKYRAALTES